MWSTDEIGGSAMPPGSVGPDLAVEPGEPGETGEPVEPVELAGRSVGPADSGPLRR